MATTWRLRLPLGSCHGCPGRSGSYTCICQPRGRSTSSSSTSLLNLARSRLCSARGCWFSALSAISPSVSFCTRCFVPLGEWEGAVAACPPATPAQRSSAAGDCSDRGRRHRSVEAAVPHNLPSRRWQCRRDVVHHRDPTHLRRPLWPVGHLGRTDIPP